MPYSGNESLLEHIMRELEKARAQVVKLEQLYEQAGGVLDTRRKRYLGMRVWRATYEYLTTQPEHKASMHDIIEELLSCGVPMGKYPKRTLSSAVTSRWVEDLFDLQQVGNGEVLRLKRMLAPEEKRGQRIYARH
jgi:hypothetical protein